MTNINNLDIKPGLLTKADVVAYIEQLSDEEQRAIAYIAQGMMIRREMQQQSA